MEIDKLMQSVQRRFAPFVYIVYVVIALFIVRKDIGNVPASVYLTLIGLGLAFLYLAISGIRDKDLAARQSKMNKREASFWGYILLVASIGILAMLYFRETIFS